MLNLGTPKKFDDTVCLIDGEKIEFLPVTKSDEVEIHTENHVFPRSDATIKFDPRGGIVYLFNASLTYLQECQHLKAVEKNIAIRNIFDYGQKDKQTDIKFFVLVAVFVIVIFLVKK